MPRRFWVLLEHERTDETAMVLVPAKDASAALHWGSDCDRGQWECLAVIEEMPSFLTLPMFERREAERDAIWYRRTERVV